MYDDLSNRLRGEAEVSNASPYIKELMRQAADSLDNLCHAVQALASTTDAPTIIPAEETDTKMVYCKECQIINNCPNQKEKDEREGNPIKEVMGCNEGIPTIIPADPAEEV